MWILKNFCNNGNCSVRSVFVVLWNLFLMRVGFFFCWFEIFIVYWYLLIISFKCYLFFCGCVFWSCCGWVKEIVFLSIFLLDLVVFVGVCFFLKRRLLIEYWKKNYVYGKIFLSVMSLFKFNCLWKLIDCLEENVFIWWFGNFFKNICN